MEGIILCTKLVLSWHVIAKTEFNDGPKATSEPPREIPLLGPKTTLGGPLTEFHFGDDVSCTPRLCELITGTEYS